MSRCRDDTTYIGIVNYVTHIMHANLIQYTKVMHLHYYELLKFHKSF